MYCFAYANVEKIKRNPEKLRNTDIRNDIDIGDDKIVVFNRLQPTLLVDGPDRTFEFSGTTRRRRNHDQLQYRDAKEARKFEEVFEGREGRIDDLACTLTYARCRYD